MTLLTASTSPLVFDVTLHTASTSPLVFDVTLHTASTSPLVFDVTLFTASTLPVVFDNMRLTTRSQSTCSCGSPVTTDDPLPCELKTAATTTTTTSSLSHEVGVMYTSADNPSTPSPIPADHHPALILLLSPSLSSPFHLPPRWPSG